MPCLEVPLKGFSEWFQPVLLRNRRNAQISGPPRMENRAIAACWMCRHLNFFEAMA
jgi:hypothetical protein